MKNSHTICTQTIKVLESIGRKKKIGANSPLFLNDTGLCYFIKKGSLNLYYTSVNDEGVPGRRNFLTTVLCSNMLFSCFKEQIMLMAVPESDTEIITVEMDSFYRGNSKLSKEEIAICYDKWISLLLKTIKYPSLPAVGKILVSGFEQTLPEKQIIYSPEKVSWIQIKRIDHETNVFGCVPLLSLGPQYFFPLTGNVWSAADKELVYNVKITLELIEKGEFSRQLNFFNNYFFNVIEQRFTMKIAEEKEALKHISEIDKNCISHIAERIKNLVGGKKSVYTGKNRKSGNVLLKACRIVGDCQGIAFDDTEIPASCSTLDQAVAAIAESSNIRYRKILFSDGWWKSDSGPILAFFRERMMPVALIPSASGSRYRVINASDGKEVKLNSGSASLISQFGYTFYRPLPHRELKAVDLIKYCSRGIFKPLSLVMMIGCMGSFMGLLTPILTEKIINHAIPKCDIFQLKQIAVILTATAIAGVLFSMTRSLIMLRYTSKIDSSLEAALLDRLFTLPIPFYRKYLAGDLAQRCAAVRSLRTIFSSSVISSILGAIFSVFYLGLCFYYSSLMAVCGLFAAVIFAVFYLVSGVVVTRFFMRPMLDISGKMQGRILQFISAIVHLRMTSSESRALANWIDDYSDYAKLQKKSRLMQSGLGIVSYLYPALTTAVFFYLVGTSIVKDVNIGVFMAFTAAYSSFQASLLSLTSPFLGFVSLIPILKRAKPILDEVPEVNDSIGGCPEVNGSIDLINIKFKYAPELSPVIDNVSMKIKPGQYVAIVGPSGSGKSTLMSIMLGFDIPENGSVYYSDSDLTKINKKDLRKQVGVVLQNSRLINASIYENIVGGTNLSVEAAWEAAQMAGVAQEISEMPMGMHTVVGVGTGGLSGGQTQRILIARAIVRSPKILFFDEATSALDNKTQAVVTKSLENLKVTRIAVAHRLSTIINADVIYVLDKGKVIQSGSFNELMKDEKGLFYELASRQMM